MYRSFRTFQLPGLLAFQPIGAFLNPDTRHLNTETLIIKTFAAFFLISHLPALDSPCLAWPA
jgi:hypothetical protein